MGAEGNGNNAASKGSRRKWALGIFFVASVTTVVSGGLYWWWRQTHIATDDAFVEGRIHPVAARIQGTVAEVLGASIVRYRRRATGYIDPLLRRIGRFRPSPSPSGMIPLAEVVAAHFRPIAETLVTNAGVTPSQATTLLHKMQQRANALHLHVRVSTMDVTVIKITSLASSLASRFALTGSLFQKA